MHLEIKDGRRNPVADGRYLCFVSSDILIGVSIPVILVWHHNTWHLQNHQAVHKPPVYGWAGPLPVGRCAQLFPDCVSEDFFKPTGQAPSNEMRKVTPPLEYDL